MVFIGVDEPGTYFPGPADEEEVYSYEDGAYYHERPSSTFNSVSLVLGRGGERGRDLPQRSRDRSEIAPTRGCVINPYVSKFRVSEYPITAQPAILMTSVLSITQEKANTVFLKLALDALINTP
jgi:hypothetical protein